MNKLVEFLKVLVGAAPEVLPHVVDALRAWKSESPAMAEAVIAQITPARDAEIDARIDAEADTARAAAGLE